MALLMFTLKRQIKCFVKQQLIPQIHQPTALIVKEMQERKVLVLNSMIW